MAQVKARGCVSRRPLVRDFSRPLRDGTGFARDRVRGTVVGSKIAAAQEKDIAGQLSKKMDTGLHKALDIVLMTMLESHQGVSDLLFVAGKPPQVEAYGKLQPVALDSAITPLESG